MEELHRLRKSRRLVPFSPIPAVVALLELLVCEKIVNKLLPSQTLYTIKFNTTIEFIRKDTNFPRCKSTLTMPSILGAHLILVGQQND